jgi:hypothetical protein
MQDHKAERSGKAEKDGDDSCAFKSRPEAIILLPRP